MNINKYFKKLNIDFKYNHESKTFIFTIENEVKEIPKKEIEQNLFLYLVEFIKKY